MDDPPYTIPEEDPFNIHPLPRRRRSSLLDKWIQEQQRYNSDPPTITTHTRSHSSPVTCAYLAYPELSRPSLDRTGPSEGAAPETAYDLVDDDDIPQGLAAEFDNLKVTDTPATIRTSTRRNSRMSLSPSSFRHFNLVFRSPSSEAEAPSRPSPRVSIFSRSNRNSTSTVTGRAIITPQTTPQKSSSKRPSQIFDDTINNHNHHPSAISPSTPPPAVRTRAPSSSKWRPSVLGHFGQSPIHLPAPAASQTSIQPPPSDSHYTPSRPSLSSSIDTSHAHTSLTVPSPEGSTSQCHHSSAHSEQSQNQFLEARSSKRYSSPVRQQHHGRHNHHRDVSTNTFAGTSSVSFRSEAYPSSINTNTNVHLTDLFNSDADWASPSPTLSSSTAPRGYTRQYPFVYNNGVQSSARRSANAFDGIPPSSYRHYHPTAPNSSVADDDDDINNDVFTTRASAAAQQQEQMKKKKPHVVYSSGSHAGTLSRMTSLSNINLALAPMIPRSRRKKKRLIVSGVAVNDVKKFEGVKRWCESFGEVRQILRMPSGDLVVSFQSAEVADTVCRVRAKVFINGVGSVQLSWTTEKKR